MEGEQGSRGTSSTKTFKKRVARLYFGSEDGILELQRKHPELFKGLQAAGPSEHGMNVSNCRVVADSSPVTGEVMKPDEHSSDDVIFESQKNYIYYDHPVESDSTISEDNCKLWLKNGLARSNAEEEKNLQINTQFHAEEIDEVYCLESTYIDEVDGCSEIMRRQLLDDEIMILKGSKAEEGQEGMKQFEDVKREIKQDKRDTVPYVCICDGHKTATPLVMLHGIGGAIPAFHMLFRKQGPECQYLFKDRYVYSIDMPGFGLSERNIQFIEEKTKEEREKLKKKIENEEEPEQSLAKFDQDIADTCEKKMLEYIEKWRKKMEIDKMILFGHSFGGYISAAYAAQFPEKVEQLVLMEPWGIFPANKYYCIEKNILSFLKLLKLKDFLSPKNFLKNVCWCLKKDPFKGFSRLGHFFGKLLLKKFLMDKDEDEKLYEENGCLNYLVNIHQMEEQQNGLNAFCYISGFSFEYSITTTPIKERLSALVKDNPHIRVLFILGENSDQDPCQDSWFKELHACSNLVKEKVVNSGHHPNVQNPQMVIELIFKHVYNQ